DVAGEGRLVAGQDVDVDRAGAGIQQDNDLVGLEAVVHFVSVLQRERVDVDDHRHAARLRDDAGVVGNLLFLGGDQQHVHRALGLLASAGVENLVIEVDVLDVEGDVLFRLPVDRLGQLRLGHNRQVDLLDDDSVAGERGCDLFGLERLVLEYPPDRVRDRRAVDDGAGDAAVGGYRRS